MTANPRRVAYDCLLRIDHHGAYANLVVPAALADSDLDQRDRGFVTDIVYGTTRMRRACDALVDRFLKRPPRPTIRTLLRMGAYQLHFAGTAAHGAVNETVQLAPKAERGFVNAVLRRVVREPMDWNGPLGEVVSYPDWIVDRLLAELGETDGEHALRAMNDPAVTHRRDDGYIQDTGSQWVVDAVGAQPGERILDLCAAPGGKATGMASNGAWVVAGDINPARVGLITHNARTLNSDVTPIVADGTMPPFATRSFDRVLLDAPCSGLGSLRRRPDARWRIQPADVGELAALQARLLTTAAALVRPGGQLIYSVCTLTAAEAIDHPTPTGFVVDQSVPGGAWQAWSHGWRLLPTDQSDGMTMIRWKAESPNG